MHNLGNRLFTYGAVAYLTASFAAGHGFFVKPCYNAEDTLQSVWINAKTNASVRGTVSGTEGNQLYMMDPQLNHTGTREVIGYRATIQDEDAATPEFIDFSYVKFDVDGVHPVEGPAGVILKSTYPTFGFGTGQVSFDYAFTIGIPQTMTEINSGFGLRLPSNMAWPADGASVHAQLNLPGHPQRFRVPPPYDKQVWAFERPEGWPEVRPLGGRTLDTLLVATMWATDPILQTFVVTDAYGNGPENLFGPESLHPVAARGDELGFFLQGGNDGENGTAYFMLSPTLSATPFEYMPAMGNKFIYLDFTSNWPVLPHDRQPQPSAWSSDHADDSVRLVPHGGAGLLGASSDPLSGDGPHPHHRRGWCEGVVSLEYTAHHRITSPAAHLTSLSLLFGSPS